MDNARIGMCAGNPKDLKSRSLIMTGTSKPIWSSVLNLRLTRFGCLSPAVVLVGLTSAGCCGTSFWRPDSLPAHVTFSVCIPDEVHVPVDEGIIKLPLVIANLSIERKCLCFATFDRGVWKYGLMPEYSVEIGNAPIKRESIRLVLDGIEGKTLCRGNAIAETDNLRLRFRPDSVISQPAPPVRAYAVDDVHPLRLEFALDPTVQPNATEGEFILYLGFRTPGEPPGSPVPMIAAPVRVVVKAKGQEKDILFSPPRPWPSRMEIVPNGKPADHDSPSSSPGDRNGRASPAAPRPTS